LSIDENDSGWILSVKKDLRLGALRGLGPSRGEVANALMKLVLGSSNGKINLINPPKFSSQGFQGLKKHHTFVLN
jgi:hypothetical protein